jgi:prolyl-tRNA synthetase
MRLSHNFTKTSKDIPSDETSKNAQLLLKAGFIHKAMAGVYAYLPLGLRVLNKIENIVRKNMNSIGGQEILMNSLHPKSWWETTDRWDAEKVDILFRLDSQTKSQYALACSHEEQVVPISKSFLSSYKDLPEYQILNSTNQAQFPVAIYQIQTKFRDEIRSKSGIMRGREFRMKDMYDFHITQESADSYYELVKETYFKIYAEMGLEAFAVHASGGMFTGNDSHEFQVICEAGEDEIFYNKEGFAVNSEILEELKAKNQPIPENLQKAKSAEVGNIFKLGDKYSKAFDLKIVDENNKQIIPIMNCHGIGTSRCMGVIAEIYSDENGLKWPTSVAPFQFHIVSSNSKNEEINKQIQDLAKEIYDGEYRIITKDDQFKIIKPGDLIELSKFMLQDFKAVEGDFLWDDRDNMSIGQKLKDADLIGCPFQIIISEKSLEKGGIEIKKRESSESWVLKINS